MKYRSPYYAKQKNLVKMNSNMNRLCFDIEKWHKKDIRFKRTYKDFDWEIMINKKIPFNEDTYKKVYEIYKEYTKEMNVIQKETQMLKDPQKYKEYFKQEYPDVPFSIFENFSHNYNYYYEKYKKACLSVCPNKQELANYGVYICYKEHKQSNKKFIWTVCSDGVLLNIQQQNIELPIRCSKEESEFSYLGKYYRMERVLDIDRPNINGEKSSE